jgi:HlyD family secretion protein
MTTVVAGPHTEQGREIEIPSSGGGLSLQRGSDPQPAVKRRRWPRVLIPIAVIGAVIGFLGWGWGQTTREAPRDMTLQGNIDVRQVNLSFKVGGRIATLLVDEGDEVEAGQVLATLDQSYFQDDLQRAKAQRDQIAANLKRLENGARPEEIEQARALEAERQATLQKAEKDLQRADSLWPSRAISASDVDLCKSAALEAKARLRSAAASRKLFEAGSRVEDIAAAKAQLEAAEAQLVAAKRALDDSRLLAPSKGVVLTRVREKGGIVNACETVFALTLTSTVWIRTYVGEPDLGLVQPGMKVVITTDAATGREYAGQIGFVSPTAEFTPKTVETSELRTALVYRLRVVVNDPDDGLRQGMPVTVSVKLPGKRPRTFKERMGEALNLAWLLSGNNGG